jgi:transmembrane sensor
MVSPFEPETNLRQASAEAAALLVRDRYTAPEDLEHWLSSKPENIGAYTRTMAMWNDLGEVIAAQSPVAAIPAQTIEAPPPTPRRVGRIAAFSAFACLIVFSLLSWTWINRTQDYQTAVGEQRIVTLPDGTRVTLNTNSEMRLRDVPGERGVILTRGEAFFDVAHDASHPFVVEASGTYVRALGTSFVVRNVMKTLDVILVTGSVKVDRGSHDQFTMMLKPGDRYSRGENGRAQRDRPKIDAVTAWRNGELVLDATPLPDAVAEMNRYSDRPILLKGEKARGMRLSGVFRTRDSESFARTIGAIYGLDIESDSRALRIGSEQ